MQYILHCRIYWSVKPILLWDQILSPPSLSSYLIFDGVRGVLLLLALLVWPADIQILHVGGQHLGHADARQDAHDWSQNQHQTHLTREQPAVH